jgi:hypothetical protein
MKPNLATKPEQATSGRPEVASAPQLSAADVLVQLVEIIMRWRAASERVTLSSIARAANRASGLLRLRDLDERLEVENAATIALAKRLGLMS